MQNPLCLINLKLAPLGLNVLHSLDLQVFNVSKYSLASSYWVTALLNPSCCSHSLPFASNYSYLGDFYNISLDRLDTLYKDERNIRYADKSGSLFYKLLEVDKEKIQNNITNSKINKIYYK